MYKIFSSLIDVTVFTAHRETCSRTICKKFANSFQLVRKLFPASLLRVLLTATFGRFLAPLLLAFSRHLFVGYIGQREVLARGHQLHYRLLYVHLCVERLPLLHGLALERGRKRAQVAEIHNVAVRHNVACRFCSKVQHSSHLLRIKRGRLGNACAEVAEIYTMPARRTSYNHRLTSLLADIQLLFLQNKLQWFISHNLFRFVSSCYILRARDS